MYNVALVGMGNIGFSYDIDPKTKTALSHAKAIYLSKEFDLKYVADLSDASLGNLKKLFPNVEYVSDYKELLEYKDIDILVIATPTFLHQRVLFDFKECENIKYFFMEKPLFAKQEEYQNIPNYLKEKIIVNYPRRFEPNFQSLSKDIKSGVYGELKKVDIHYSKGFSNNASHIIDYLNFLLGDFSIVQSKILDATTGFNKDDLTLDVFAKIKLFENEVNLYFLGFDHNYLTEFSLEFFFEKAIIKYDDTMANISIREIKPDTNYPEYLVASQQAKTIEVMMDKIMLLAYRDLANRFVGNDSFACSYDEELSNVKFKYKVLGR